MVKWAPEILNLRGKNYCLLGGIMNAWDFEFECEELLFARRDYRSVRFWIWEGKTTFCSAGLWKREILNLSGKNYFLLGGIMEARGKMVRWESEILNLSGKMNVTELSDWVKETSVQLRMGTCVAESKQEKKNLTQYTVNLNSLLKPHLWTQFTVTIMPPSYGIHIPCHT